MWGGVWVRDFVMVSLGRQVRQGKPAQDSLVCVISVGSGVQGLSLVVGFLVSGGQGKAAVA